MKRKLFLSILSILIVSIFLISACAQQQVKEPEKVEEKAEPIAIKIISLPQKWIPDENLTITWQVTGSKGDISHTAIHYDTTSHDADFQLYKKASTYQTGNVPQLFRTSVKATKEKFMYIRAHAIVDGNHYYDDERSILIELPVAPVEQKQEVKEPVQETITEPEVKELAVEADDNAFYPSSIEVQKGSKAKLTLKVRSEGVYFGGLLFTSDEVKYNSGDIKPGGSTVYEFTADNSFTISSWWPSSRRFKADFKVNVK